jgi:hypothetical protein
MPKNLVVDISCTYSLKYVLKGIPLENVFPVHSTGEERNPFPKLPWCQSAVGYRASSIAEEIIGQKSVPQGGKRTRNCGCASDLKTILTVLVVSNPVLLDLVDLLLSLKCSTHSPNSKHLPQMAYYLYFGIGFGRLQVSNEKKKGAVQRFFQS